MNSLEALNSIFANATLQQDIKLETVALSDAMPVSDKEKLFIEYPVKEFIEKYDLDPVHIEALDDFIAPSHLFVENPPMIAGGYLRRWVQGEKYEDMTCDIDLYPTFQPAKPFIPGKPNMEVTDGKGEFHEYIKLMYGTEFKEDDKGYHNYSAKISLLKDKEFMVQYMNHIKFMFSSDMAGMKNNLSSFDCTMSQIGYFFPSRTIVVAENFYDHAMNKIIHFNRSSRLNSPPSQLKRFHKFIADGYTMDEESYTDFIKWSYHILKDNNGSITADTYGQ